MDSSGVGTRGGSWGHPPLREEARESWDYVVSDKMVHRVQVIEVAGNFPIEVSKDHLEGNLRIECHLTFQSDWNVHYQFIVESAPFRNQQNGQCHDSSRAENGNSHMLVDVAHLVQTPELVSLNVRGIRSVVRLKRFYDGRCLYGHSFGPSLDKRGVRFLQNRKLGISGIRKSFLCEIPNELVERRSEVENKIPSNERDSVGSVRDLHPDDMPLILKIILSQKAAGLRFIKDLQFLPQVFKMFFRPSCLEVGVSQAQGARRTYQHSLAHNQG